MTILITGSSGKTSSRLAALLRPSHPILIASRSGAHVDGVPAVKFDWSNESSYKAPFEHAQSKEKSITAVYLVANPNTFDPSAELKAFIDVARSYGVKRFVLLSHAAEDEHDPFGQVHTYLKQLGVEWAVLQPTWFMENFSELYHQPTIKNESKLYSATSSGTIPFVSASDVAAVACHTLTDERAPNTTYHIVGPQLHSFDDVAQILSAVLGRDVSHVKLTEPEMAQHLVASGLPQDLANMLAALDTGAAEGHGAVLNDVVLRATGHVPISLRDFAEANKQAWTV